MRGACNTLLALMAFASLTAGGAAAARGLKALRAPAKVSIDGLPKEWDGDWRALDQAVQGSAGKGDLEARAVVQYDQQALYVAADVTDDKLVGGADHVELLLGIPGGTLFPIRLYPGVSGRRAVAKTGSGSTIRGAVVVEAPKDGGYTLEAKIPWSQIPKSSTVRVGFRGALLVHDADSASRVETILGSSSARSYASLPALSTEPELALGAGLRRKRNITGSPKRNLLADVIGDRLLERVLVYDRFLVVLGPGYRGGEGYYFRDLLTADIRQFEVKDFTGDGKPDLLIRKRVGGKLGSVEVLEILSYHSGDDTPAVAFGQEVALELKEGSIRNDVQVSGSGSGTTITVSAGTSSGLDAARFRRESSTGATAVLEPWGSIASQTYKVKNGKLVLASERTHGAPKVAAAKPEPKPAVARPTTPAPSNSATSADPDAVYALYKKQRGVNGRASFDVSGNVSEDRRSERVVVHGTDVVVFGPGFRGGRGFAATTLPFAKGGDIEKVYLRDVNGDGRSEIVVHGQLAAEVPEDAGGGTMQRSVVMILKVKGAEIERVFAAELGRRIGDKRVEARLDFIKQGEYRLRLQPGKAVGFTATSYPWVQKDTPDGGFEPLLLPWGGIKEVRLKYDGGKFVR